MTAATRSRRHRTASLPERLSGSIFVEEKVGLSWGVSPSLKLYVSDTFAASWFAETMDWMREATDEEWQFDDAVKGKGRYVIPMKELRARLGDDWRSVVFVVAVQMAEVLNQRLSGFYRHHCNGQLAGTGTYVKDRINDKVWQSWKKQEAKK